MEGIDPKCTIASLSHPTCTKAVRTANIKANIADIKIPQI